MLMCSCTFLLHCTSTSLMAYSIVFTSPFIKAAAGESPSVHKTRSIGNLHSLLSPSAKSNVKLDNGDDAKRPLMARRSSQSEQNGDEGPLDVQSRFDAFSDSVGGKSLTKLLASRKLGKNDGKAITEQVAAVTFEEGVEVERDGGGGWTGIRLGSNGSGARKTT